MARRKKNEPLYFVVEGSGLFPFDMLRYDCAYPTREREDSYQLGDYERLGRRRVMLTTLVEKNPTAARWESFNWKLLDQDTDKYELERRTMALPPIVPRTSAQKG